MSNNLNIERRLSPMEKYLWLIDRECRINFMMHAHIHGEVDEKIMRIALDAIQARHPLLRVRIEQDGWSNLKFTFGDVPQVPLRVIKGPPECWVKEAEDDLNTIFPTDVGPLLRSTLIRHDLSRSTVLLAFHHSIGDGLSGAYLIRDLFAAASLASEGKDAKLPDLQPKREVETYFPAWARGLRGRWQNIKFSLRIFSHALCRGRPTVPKFDGNAPARGRKAHIIARKLSAKTVNRLHEKAHKYDTTLHGAFLSAQILAIAHDRDVQKPRPFFVGSPVNLRLRLTPPVKEDVGFFVTMGLSINRCSIHSDFWSLARDVRKSLWNSVERGDPFVFYFQQKDLSKLAALTGIGRWGTRIYANIAGKLAMGGLPGFSNIGMLPIETTQGPFKVESLGFAASGSVMTPYPTFAASIETQTTWNFVGMEPLLSKEHTERLADKTLEILLEAMEL